VQEKLSLVVPTKQSFSKKTAERKKWQTELGEDSQFFGKRETKDWKVKSNLTEKRKTIPKKNRVNTDKL